MITGDAVLCHMIGDYVLQSDWMAMNKTGSWRVAAVHVLCYGLPFLALRPSLAAWAFIVGTHFVIDHWRLARHVGWAKNFLAPRHIKVEMARTNRADPAYEPLRKDGAVSADGRTVEVLLRNHPWAACSGTGYDASKPPFMAVWLMIVVDQVMHVALNGLALTYL